MHVVQTMTAIHDRHLSAPLTSRQTTTEMYHLSQAAALFNEGLSSNVKSSDRDALWITAAMLGIIAFSWIDATNPEEAWPISDTKPNNLEWIKMSELKPAVWHLTNPLRPDSPFHVLQKDYESLAHGPGDGRIENVPCAFLELYNLNSSSNAENNPYYAAVLGLATLLQLECDRSNVFRFLSFISRLGDEFKKLLILKDPRALLLLAYWYAKVCRSGWWLVRRAILEGQAICLYLERNYPDAKDIQQLLQFPKMSCAGAATYYSSGISID